MATESDNVNTGALATIVIVGALAMIGITTALTALVRTQQNDKQDQMNSTADLKAYQQMVASQRAELTKPPSWDDKSEGIVRIPVDRAEQLVVTELQKNPYSATPIPPDAGTDGAAEAGATEADAGAATADGGAPEATDAGAPEAPEKKTPKAPKGAAPGNKAPKPAGNKPAPTPPAPPAPGGAGTPPAGGSPAPTAPKAPSPDVP